MTKAEYAFMAAVACLLDEMTGDRRFEAISRHRLTLSKSCQALSEQYAEQEKQDAARHWSYPQSLVKEWADHHHRREQERQDAARDVRVIGLLREALDLLRPRPSVEPSQDNLATAADQARQEAASRDVRNLSRG
jgi:hypothetical protein